MQALCRGGLWRSPVVFLTNGGGCTEAKKAAELAGWLDAPVTEDQVILSHTPFRDLAGRLGDAPVLAAGRRDVLEVAERYGFRRVVTSYDLVAAGGGSAVPFGAAALPAAVAARRQRSGCPVLDRGWGTPAAPIRAVLVFNDPPGDAWYQELQLLHDTVTGHGVPLDRHPAPGSRPVEVFFSNPDLLWANDHPRPRFGQGAFASALEALHRATTGRPIPAVRYFGKPHPEPYRLAERLLLRQAKALGLAPPDHDAADAASAFSAIFAVGDNPAADVRGANSAGAPWVSVLVRTGVFEGPPGANDPSDPAHLVVDDVAAAVEAAHHRARHAKWHAMR